MISTDNIDVDSTETKLEETKKEIEYLDDEEEINPFANMCLGWRTFTDKNPPEKKNMQNKLDLLRISFQDLKRQYFKINNEIKKYRKIYTKCISSQNDRARKFLISENKAIFNFKTKLKNSYNGIYAKESIAINFNRSKDATLLSTLSRVQLPAYSTIGLYNTILFWLDNLLS